MMPSKKNLFLALTLPALLAVAPCGCGTKEKESRPGATKSAEGVKSPLQKKISSAAPPSLQEQFDFSSKKDPFRSFVAATRAKLPLPPISENQIPIQKYEVNQFKLMGIITGLTENRAMVLDPTGKSYVVKEGSLIGPHNGRVRSIKPTALEVAEQYREENGKIRNRGVKLTLPRKE